MIGVIMQFDVCRNIGKTKSGYPYFVILQSDLFDGYKRSVVIPLVPYHQLDGYVDHRLFPRFVIEERDIALATLSITNIPAGQLGERVASLSGEEETIIAAIDWMMLRR